MRCRKTHAFQAFGYLAPTVFTELDEVGEKCVGKMHPFHEHGILLYKHQQILHQSPWGRLTAPDRS